MKLKLKLIDGSYTAGNIRLCAKDFIRVIGFRCRDVTLWIRKTKAEGYRELKTNFTDFGLGAVLPEFRSCFDWQAPIYVPTVATLAILKGLGLTEIPNHVYIKAEKTTG